VALSQRAGATVELAVTDAMNAPIEGQPADGRPKSLTAIVRDRLLADIVDGSIPLGTLLSEKVLAARFNVSKTPVREALVQLTSLGLVDILPQRGGRVFSPDVEQVRQICEVRLELEAIALRLSMQRNPSRLHNLLDTIVTEMELVFDLGDPRQYQQLDSRFHSALFEHCGNHLLRDAYELFSARIAALRTNLSTPHRYLLKRSLEEHRWLVELVARGDLKSALILLEEHVARTRQFHLQSLEETAA
jgi:DNA-binding GntR family transcriptional regulator